MHALGLRLSRSSKAVVSSASNNIGSWTVHRCHSRRIHNLKLPPYSIEGGLGEFLPPDALRTVAVDYQGGLIDRLNDEVKGTDNEGKSVAQIVINSAPFRNRTLAFNYASLALNNSFYLGQLRPPPPLPKRNHESHVSASLMSRIRENYLSLEELKSQFSAAALGLSASGWVWCVMDIHGNLSILPTHGAGTLLIRSREYMGYDNGLEDDEGPQRKAGDDDFFSFIQSTRTNPTQRKTPPGVSPASPTSGTSTNPTPSSSNPVPGFRFMHATTQTSFSTSLPSHLHASPAHNISPLLRGKPESISNLSSASSRNTDAPLKKVEYLNMGKTLYPLFCVSVHEHNWLSAGYGVWGKEEWMKKFWTVLDWEIVSNNYASVAKPSDA